MTARACLPDCTTGPLLVTDMLHSNFPRQPCGPSQIEKLRIREMDPYLSFWNLMA